MRATLVNKKRIRELRGGDIKSGPVLYWCSRDQRVNDNWALIHACESAASIGGGVVVVFNLVTSFLGAGARQFGFMLRGLREMETTLKTKGIEFILLEGDPTVTVSEFAKRCGAALLVTDQSPLRIGREWRKVVAHKSQCPVHEVDAHNVVPVWEASPKLEVGARTLRGKLEKLYPEFLEDFPELPTVGALCSDAHDAVLKIGKVDWEQIISRAVEAGAAVPEVKWALPGEQAARLTLEHFLNRRLKLYGLRNDPSKPQALSGLSPYLHFGQISSQRCALEAKRYSKTASQAVAVFFEELVVRRELADNFCWYNPKYDSIEGQKYEWATDTLKLHAFDKRPYVYTLDQFEHGQTHDDLWNAAQLEMVHGGKMHGFMRMYWAKKILEWTESPEQALEFAIFLNDKYQLDGRDPSGYVGCMWSIVGVHDQGWRERPIFGKIRYMSYGGCEKKFKVKDYISRVCDLVAAVKAGDNDPAAQNPGCFNIDFARASVGTAALAGTGELSQAKCTSVCPAEELTRLVRAAVSAGLENTASRAMDALNVLKDTPVTAELLVQTQVGKELKRVLKQGSGTNVGLLAKALLKAWKTVLTGDSV
eukprot:31524-Pelagococcus_subviridis.AAC.3